MYVLYVYNTRAFIRRYQQPKPGLPYIGVYALLLLRTAYGGLYTTRHAYCGAAEARPGTSPTIRHGRGLGTPRRRRPDFLTARVCAVSRCLSFPLSGMMEPTFKISSLHLSRVGSGLVHQPLLP